MTNDTTPATDERITAIRRYLYDQLSEEDQPRSFNEDAEYMLGVIEALQAENAGLRGKPVELSTWQIMVDALLRCDRFVRDMLEEHGQGSGTFDVICKALDAAGVPPTKDRASKGESHE